MSHSTRRSFQRSAADAGSTALFPAPFQRLAAALRKEVKITDVKFMNPASPIGTIASAHAASSMCFRFHELAKYVDWRQDLVIHEGPIFEHRYLTIQDKRGYGVELTPDVAKAHLAPGETWWG